MAFKNEESIISNDDDRRRNSTNRSRRSATTFSNPSHQMSILQLTRNGASFLTGSMFYLADESVPGHSYHRGAQDGRQIDGRCCFGVATQDLLPVMPSPPSIRVGRAGHPSSVRSHANCNVAEIIDAALRIVNDDQDNHGEQEQCLLWHRSPSSRPRNGAAGSRHPEENDGRRASNEEEARRSMQRQSPQ